jgi:hypothetical protein
VLVVDETGDVKKGTHTVGVQRQYTGTAGRIENAQVAVYLVYAGLRGHAAVDRELYLPHSWTRGPDRCRAAGLDEGTAFATKPELAARMIGRFLDAGHRAGWVAADEVYGGNPKLCSALEERQVGYVLAVACSHEATTGAGKFRVDEHVRRPAPEGLIPLTCNEIQRLFITLVVRPVREVAHRLAGTVGPRPSHPCQTPATLPTSRPLTRRNTEVRLEYQGCGPGRQSRLGHP